MRAVTLPALVLTCTEAPEHWSTPHHLPQQRPSQQPSQHVRSIRDYSAQIRHLGFSYSNIIRTGLKPQIQDLSCWMTVLTAEKNDSQRGVQAEKMDASIPGHGKAPERRSAPAAVISFIE